MESVKPLLDKILSSPNYAEEMDDADLDRIGLQLCEAVSADMESRRGWMERNYEWLKLAAQVREPKNFPWQNASNVKYPLLTLTALQFHARALQGLIPGDKPIKAKVIGYDETGAKLRRANRVSTYMSHQVLHEMPEWVDDLDRMMFVLPIIGLCYKKTYFSPSYGRARSIMLLPDELVVNYHARDFARARKSHVIHMDENEVIENQRAGIYRDIDLPKSSSDESLRFRDELLGLSEGSSLPDDVPRALLEVHDRLDLDGDGYKEPYIITIDSESHKVLRIVAGYKEDAITFNDDGDVRRIDAEEYFTQFIFFPDPTSSIYGIGFGALLGPTNEAINTIYNQLIDAGTMSNTAGGLIGRGAKLPGGTLRFKPNEWHQVNVTGDDLRKSIFPWPVREPSNVLLSLAQLLLDSGMRVGSVTDTMVGNNPGQNQPAFTTQAVLEQGMAVFRSVYARIHRALSKEYMMIYLLNGKHLDEERYRYIIDDTSFDLSQLPPDTPPEAIQQMYEKAKKENMIAGMSDFAVDGIDILPASDPTMITDAQRLMRGRSLLEKMQMGLPINPAVVTRQVLQAEQHEDIDALMAMPEQPPSIEERQFDIEVQKFIGERIDQHFANIKTVAETEALEAGSQMDTYIKLTDAIMSKEAKSGANEQRRPEGQPQPIGQ